MKKESTIIDACKGILWMFVSISVLFLFPAKFVEIFNDFNMPNWQLYVFNLFVVVVGMCGLFVLLTSLWLIFLPPVSANGQPLKKIAVGDYRIISCDIYCKKACLVLDGGHERLLFFSLPLRMVFGSNEPESICLHDYKCLVVKQEGGYTYCDIVKRYSPPSVAQQNNAVSKDIVEQAIEEGMPVPDNETLSVDSTLAIIEERIPVSNSDHEAFSSE
jgi:hypothetical protein